MKKRAARLAAIVLACGMIFALGACGNKDDASADAQATEAQADDQVTGADENAQEAMSGDMASEEAGESTGMANPWVEDSIMEEACNAAGFSFNVPETVGSYVGLHFSVMNNELIQVVYGEPDKGVTIRKAEGSEDISGDYTTYSEEKEVDVNGTTVKMSGNDGTVSLAIWEKDGYSYSANVIDEENPGLSQSAMEEIVQAAW